MTSPIAELNNVSDDVRSAFGWMLEPTRLIERYPAELLRQPATMIDRVATRMALSLKQRIAQIGPDGFIRDMFSVLDSLPECEKIAADACFVSRAAQAAARDPSVLRGPRSARPD